MIDLDFGEETTARAHVSQLDPTILTNPQRLQDFQNATGLSKEEIIGLIYEKKSKRVHVAMKPTLYGLINKYAKEQNMTVTAVLIELAICKVLGRGKK